MAARIDHRSYKEQGIDLIPTIHEGYEVRAMEKKGIKTIIGELNRAIRQFNQMFISLKESIQTTAPKFLCGDETEREESLQLTGVCKVYQLSSDTSDRDNG